MKIEKLNENKIKITFSNEDLKENHFTIDSFKSNSIENQTLFFNLLDIAQKEVGFVTENYQIAIETLLQSNDNFTLIISRFSDKSLKKNKHRLHISRKISRIENTICLYKFESFESFFDFSNYLFNDYPDLFFFAIGKTSLYKYNNSYFLEINKIKLSTSNSFKFTSIFSEFSEYINISEITFQKFKECSTTIAKNNAIGSCISA